MSEGDFATVIAPADTENDLDQIPLQDRLLQKAL